MNKDDFYFLGKILKTHGNKGQVQVHLDVDDTENYQNKEELFHGKRVVIRVKVRDSNLEFRVPGSKIQVFIK